MKNKHFSLIVLIITAFTLAACQPATMPVATQPQAAVETPVTDNSSTPQNAGGFVPNLAGPITECRLEQSIPVIPPDQIPPIPPVSAEDWIMGSPDAEISIIEYSDFQCPHCANAASQLEKFFQDNADKVNFAFRHLPLISIHPKAILAHQAADAAGAQGKFFEMHDLLFAEQKIWSADTVTSEGFLDYAVKLAEKLELDIDQFKEDFDSLETKTKIMASFTDATENIGINGTPTVFIVINGVPYAASYDYGTLTNIMKLIELDKKRFTECPPMVINVEKVYEATITTSKGDIKVELYPEKAPLTVNSFVFLATQGFYNNVEFHRVIPGFVAQVGDPSGLGIGGPGYKYVDEISDLKFDSEGVLGMAKSTADSNGSQFFITYAAQSSLDGKYTVFGKVIDGMDVLNKITANDPQSGILADKLDRIISISIDERE